MPNPNSQTPAIQFENPFRPGAGHMPPYLAGRTAEHDEIKRLLRQRVVMENAVLTGLRGVGKSVLLETFRPIARSLGWLWAGTDLSESASVTEETLATRILADIALVTSALFVSETRQLEMGFVRTERIIQEPLDYSILRTRFDSTPGLIADKLKSVLEFVWSIMPQSAISGIVFAYDEAQNLADHAEKNEYPLSLILDVFQSIQRKSIPFMLVLAGLPTLFPKLVEARTYTERMFHLMFLVKLDDASSRDAIIKPTQGNRCPLKFSDEAVANIVKLSGGYPYFIQFICKEVFDVWIAKIQSGEVPTIPSNDIVRKLDSDFFQGRWAKATDRQRDLLQVIALLPNADSEFTVQEVYSASKKYLQKPFTSSHISQMLVNLGEAGLVYKNRWGKYSLAVPLLSQFILRQNAARLNLPKTLS
jgi:AAA ATPase domain